MTHELSSATYYLPPGTSVRVTEVNHYAFTGRTPHPTPADIGLTGTVVSVDADVLDKDSHPVDVLWGVSPSQWERILGSHVGPERGGDRPVWDAYTLFFRVKLSSGEEKDFIWDEIEPVVPPAPVETKPTPAQLADGANNALELLQALPPDRRNWGAAEIEALAAFNRRLIERYRVEGRTFRMNPVFSLFAVPTRRYRVAEIDGDWVKVVESEDCRTSAHPLHIGQVIFA